MRELPSCATLSGVLVCEDRIPFHKDKLSKDSIYAPPLRRESFGSIRTVLCRHVWRWFPVARMYTAVLAALLIIT
jgi:hypothetical protein